MGWRGSEADSQLRQLRFDAGGVKISTAQRIFVRNICCFEGDNVDGTGRIHIKAARTLRREVEAGMG